MITATVSGSFHRHLRGIYSAVGELLDAGVKVLSPADPRVVDHAGEFLFVASDRVRSIRLVQDRHLQCIKRSAFLWLVAPDGYVGQSASMELGFAVASGTPVFSTTLPNDITLREYVTRASSVRSCVEKLTATSQSNPTRHVLVDPRASIEEGHLVLDRLGQVLCNRTALDRRIVESTVCNSGTFFLDTFDLRRKSSECR